MDYPSAASHAKTAYLKVLAAASQISIQVEPQSWQVDYKAKGTGYMFVDTLEGHRIEP